MAARKLIAMAALVTCASCGCGKTNASPAPIDAAPPPAITASGPRIMPAVGADSDQLLPEVPPGYTACTKDVFDPRVDEKTAAERAAVWQAEAAKVHPTLHRADVRAASGARDDDTTSEKTRPEGIVRFTVPKGELELRFPGRLSTIRTAPRAVAPVYARITNSEKAHDFVLAPLGEDAHVMIGDGWVYRGTNGVEPGMEVDVYLVKESVEDTTKVIAKHAEHALEATTCSIEEGWYQRGAYLVKSEIAPDGSASILLAGTSGGHCTPRDRWEELLVARRVADVTIVMTCRVSGDGGKALCKSALASARLRSAAAP